MNIENPKVVMLVFDPNLNEILVGRNEYSEELRNKNP